MQWLDTGFVLAARQHGESAMIVQLLTSQHGRHAGLVRGGQSPRMRAVLQPGNEVVAKWRGRLAEHLGTVGCELACAHAARLLDDPDRLAALASAAALLAVALPEQEPQPDVFTSFAHLISALDSAADWPLHYVKWEQELLGAIGFGLDLSRCAVSGGVTDLAYVSPRTGRAVSLEAGRPYHDKLLPLPGFLWRGGAADPAAVADGLLLTGYLLERHVFAPQGRAVPEVLVSGDHRRIREWRRGEAERLTRERRPDLWARYIPRRAAGAKTIGMERPQE